MKLTLAFLCLLVALCFGPGTKVSHAQFGYVEIDARIAPWSSITRLALEGGNFPPVYRPVSENEIAHIIIQSQNQATTGLARGLSDPQENARLLFLLNRYQNGGGSLSFHGYSCLKHPPHLRISDRVIGGYSGLGDTVPFEGGLSFAPGYNVFLEPSVEFAARSFWSVLNFRIGGQVAQGGTKFDEPGGNSNPITWPGWPIPTGKYEVRNARLKGGAWTGQITRALMGLQLGNWALSAGYDQRRTGPGLTGNLNQDFQGRPIPAITARRTSSFKWGGILTHLAPDQLLMRTGLLSERKVSWKVSEGRESRQANPYFFQWLLGWNVTSWFRTTFTHSVMATAIDGTLWPDLFQINFPIIGTTQDEEKNGPITDRLFAVQFEFRWNDAPWPLLPSSAGRLFWDYGGTDFLPSGPGGIIPQISIPASIAGFELLSPRWDLSFEYAEFQHDKVLWYSNGGYPEGYSQEGWLMAHPLGGSGESFTTLVRLRPAGWNLQAEFQGKYASWGMAVYTPGTGERTSLGLTLAHIPRDIPQNDSPPLLWQITAEWNREKADPSGHLTNPPPGSEVQQDWWRLIFKIGI